MTNYDQKRKAYLMDNCGCTEEDADEQYEDVQIYEGERLVGVAKIMVEDGLFGHIPERIANYIDYDKIADDLSCEGWVELDGDVYYSC